MSHKPDASEKPGLAMWLLLAYAAITAFLAGISLIWILWSAVPVHGALFEGLGATLPRSMGLTFAASELLPS